MQTGATLMKEHLDPVPEFDSTELTATIGGDARKPKLTSTQSDGSLTIFSNGHHKPAHKHNHLAHNCAPYKIPKPHSIHGSSDVARRSVDSLPATKAVDGGLSMSPISDSIISAQQEVRLIKSEHTSPEIRATSNFDQQNGQLQPLDLSFSDFGASQLDSCATSYDYWSPDADTPIYSAGLNIPPSDWSALDLPLDSNAFDPTSVRAPYVFDYSNLVQPALTNSSSGEPSEVDDFIPVNDTLSYRPPSLVHNSDSSDSYEGGETESYRLSNTSSFMGLPQASMLSSSNLESLDIDEFLKGAAAGTATFEGSDVGGEPPDNEVIGTTNYRFNETRKWAVDDRTDDAGLNLPLTSSDPDNLWITQLSQGAPLGPDDDVPETVWNS
ncbi:MAG: hypothetical protein M1840_004441 [Geoglossum simile]|nr:MAG: hypothetical protein M1840_004441 [Geoglossum simile]